MDPLISLEDPAGFQLWARLLEAFEGNVQQLEMALTTSIAHPHLLPISSVSSAATLMAGKNAMPASTAVTNTTASPDSSILKSAPSFDIAAVSAFKPWTATPLSINTSSYEMTPPMSTTGSSTSQDSCSVSRQRFFNTSTGQSSPVLQEPAGAHRKDVDPQSKAQKLGDDSALLKSHVPLYSPSSNTARSPNTSPEVSMTTQKTFDKDAISPIVQVDPPKKPSEWNRDKQTRFEAALEALEIMELEHRSDGPLVQISCQWGDCEAVFEHFYFQRVLLNLSMHLEETHIVRDDEIKDNYKFACKWKGCHREKNFNAAHSLVNHLPSHTGLRLFTCDFPDCSKSYSRLENLRSHENAHTGIALKAVITIPKATLETIAALRARPYDCRLCDKAFPNASDRAKHENRTHSSNKPYICNLPGCTKKYTDPSSLRKHIKAVHGDSFHKSSRISRVQVFDYRRWPEGPRMKFTVTKSVPDNSSTTGIQCVALPPVFPYHLYPSSPAPDEDDEIIQVD